MLNFHDLIMFFDGDLSDRNVSENRSFCFVDIFLRRKVKRCLAVPRFCIYFQRLLSPEMSLYGQSGNTSDPY